jgi:hypothetical protein
MKEVYKHHKGLYPVIVESSADKVSLEVPFIARIELKKSDFLEIAQKLEYELR